MIDIVRNFPFFSIFLAMFSGIITAPIRRGRAAWWVSFVMTLLVTAMSAVLLHRLSIQGENYTFMMGHFPAPWGNELKAGPLEAMMATLFGVVMLLSLLGGREDAFRDILPPKQKLYFVMLNMLFGSMIALIYTNDIFTAYVFIEISTIAACSIIMAKDTPRSLVATMRYLIMMLLGSGLFLIGIIILYSITGHLLMENIAESLRSIAMTGEYNEPLRIVVSLIIMGIAIKCALFPFHTMLPGAYSMATTTSSAVLAGLASKSFMILLVKLFFRVFTVELLSSLGITQVLYGFGALAVAVCSYQAWREQDLKRMLAYSSCTNIGYIFMALGLAMTDGGTAACFHIVAHALAKSMLFLSVCGLQNAAGVQDANAHQLRGMAHRDKLAGVGFTLGGLTMIGLPLTSGFATKIAIATAALNNTPVLIITLGTLLISVVFSAMYFIPAVIAVWTRDGASDEASLSRAPLSNRASIFALIALNALLGVSFQPVMDLIRRGIGLL